MFRPIISLVILLLAAFPAFADTFAPPCPRKFESQDSMYAFVALPKQTRDECSRSSDADATTGRELRTKFTKSGLYEDGDPARPRWTIDEHFTYEPIFVSNDGNTVVKRGTFSNVISSDTISTYEGSSVIAITIYKDGREFRKYTVGDFVRNEDAVKHTVTTVRWSKNIAINNEISRLIVETLDDLRYEIDLGTGEIVDRKGIGTEPDSTIEPKTGDIDDRKSSCFGIAIIFGAAFILSFRRSL